MPRTSAGLLPFRRTGDGVEVFVAHMGGPFWAKRPRAYTVVKGEYGPGEEPREAAAREFREEIGVDAPAGEWLDLGQVRQSGGKVVTAFAVELAPGAELEFVASNEVEIEWPPRSGRRISVPEVDRADWLPADRARDVLVAAQTAFLDRLADLTG